MHGLPLFIGERETCGELEMGCAAATNPVTLNFLMKRGA